MRKLRATLIDVGWGDSILVESEDQAGRVHYGLIDSNDTSTFRSSYIHLRRFFEKAGESIPSTRPLFDWVLLSHAHTDHGQGLKSILKDFGTEHFWYPKSKSSAAFFSALLRFARLSPRVAHHESVDSNKIPQAFGEATIEILWPPNDYFPDNENNNSVVIAVRLGQACLLLTGDAEAPVWQQIHGQIPADVSFFKLPHHGSQNGFFDSQGNTPWLTGLNPGCQLGISSHVRPFSHPDQEVIDRLDLTTYRYYRTDLHSHLTFEVSEDGVSRVRYSHFAP